MAENGEYWTQQAGPATAGYQAQQATASPAGYQAQQQVPGAGQQYRSPADQADYAQPQQQWAYQQAAPQYAAAAPQQPARQKKGKGWIVAIVVIVCLFLFTAFSVAMCTSALDSLSSTGLASSIDDIDRDTIGIIELDGTIQYDGSLCSPEGLKKMLDDAEKNEHVKAVVLRVNSGGGTATAGEEMAEYLRQFTKPVVVSSASINASAAYEISSQADYIYVAKSTEIGAIGTVMQMTDLSGLLDKLGVKMDTIASAESKDSSYGYRALTDEERDYYQKMVDQINDMFVENVAEGRKMSVEDVRKLATGLVFTGVDAVDNGLADAIGTREDAIAKAAELAGISDYETASLDYSSYDLSSLAYLFGESRSNAGDLLEELQTLKDSQAK